MNSKCEILKPYFIKNVNISRENVKDYIEVNSAIALALQGLGEGIKKINEKVHLCDGIFGQLCNIDLAPVCNKVVVWIFELTAKNKDKID